MSSDRMLSRALVGLLAAGCLLFAGPAPAAPEDEVVPEDLPAARKQALKKFLGQLPRPKRFFPQGAKVVGAPPPGVNLA